MMNATQVESFYWQSWDFIPLFAGFLIIYILVWSHFRPPLGYSGQLSFKNKKEGALFIIGAFVGMLSIFTIALKFF